MKKLNERGVDVFDATLTIIIVVLMIALYFK